MTPYQQFLEQKKRRAPNFGIAPSVALPLRLYDWQAAIVRWAIQKGRSAIFADCGLGKTYMQVAWAQALSVPTLFLAPLCVAEQTIAEAHALGVTIAYANEQRDVHGPLVITNYERLSKFDASAFQAVVLDESSILKSFDGKTRTALIETFARTPYRLCCTATPSPNDIAELANHAEFLGLCTRAEFLATWFVHDDNGWRMKRHAVEPFFQWLGTWAVAVSSPADLDCDDAGYRLPPLAIQDVIVHVDHPSEGRLFPDMAVHGIGGRLKARHGSIDERLSACADLVRSTPGQWIVWCGLNTESDGIARLLGDGAINVQGSDTHAEKAGAIRAFLDGSCQWLVTKARILGWGMNFQHCHQMAFLGLGDSYELYYQAIRRCWRYGQREPVTAAVIVSEAEAGVVANVRRKEAEAVTLSAKLREPTRASVLPHLEVLV